MSKKSYIIVRDTREQTGWTWEPDDQSKKSKRIPILGTLTETLDAGDYSIKGMEDHVRIERKAGFAELYGNLTNKENKERFYREMERLAPLPFRCIAIESNLTADMLGMSPCSFFRPIPASKIIDELLKIQDIFGIPHYFVGDAGKKFARIFFENSLRSK